MARALLAKLAPAVLITIVVCGALTGCVYPGPYAAYPAYGYGPRPVVVGYGYGYGWRHWR